LRIRAFDYAGCGYYPSFSEAKASMGSLTPVARRSILAVIDGEVWS
jgi:hypothetical protein